MFYLSQANRHMEKDNDVIQKSSLSFVILQMFVNRINGIQKQRAFAGGAVMFPFFGYEGGICHE